ncbi:MAG: tetratricopeptide repeat protein [Vampirovibrionales bacterium]|nr:tetratricopeptide repeat protein [Vampirovibrionales bacterium]
MMLSTVVEPQPLRLSADDEATVLAVRHGASVGVLPLLSLRLFAVTGKGAAHFLHNRTTNDVAALQPGEGHWNAVLDKSAHVLGHFWLGRPVDSDSSPTFWLVVEKAIAHQTVKALLQYKIMEDVTLIPQEGWGCVAVCGVHAQSLLASLDLLPKTPLPGLGTTSFRWQEVDGLAIRQSTTGEDSYWLWLPQDSVGQLMAAINGECLSTAAYNTLCLEAGTLAAGRDYDATTLLPETGLEQACVSYTKGCYLGQETVARVKTYGSLPKALVGLVFQTIPSVGPDAVCGELTLAEDTQTVGRLTHVQYSPTLGAFIGLAYFAKDYRIPGKTLLLRLNTPKAGMNLEATVTLLPFVGNDYKETQAKKHLNEGLTAFANGNDFEATALLRQALALSPTNPDALEALSAVLGRQGQYEEALALALQLVAIEPNRVMAYTNLSVFYMQLGDKDKAEEAKAQATLVSFRNAMGSGSKLPLSNGSSEAPKNPAQTEPTFALTPEQRATLEDKVALFRSALQHSPNDPLGNFGLGCALLDLGRAQDAIEALSRTVGLKTSQSTAYTKLGQAYELLHDWVNARSAYTQGIEVASVRRDLMALKTLQDRLDALQEK